MAFLFDLPGRIDPRYFVQLPQKAELLIQPSLVLLLALQVLLSYASLRSRARQLTAPSHAIILPPKALRVLLCVFLVVPLLADMQNRFILAARTKTVIEKLSQH